MASYLCVKMNSSATKSYNIKSSANKPYLRVDTGFIPLTTATATGPKLMVRAGGVNYRLADFITTTTAITTGTSYLTSAKTTSTSYVTGSRASTSGTGYQTRSSTSSTGYLTRSSTSATGYLTRASTSATGYLTRASTSKTTYTWRSSTYGTSYATRASTSKTDYKETTYKTYINTYTSFGYYQPSDFNSGNDLYSSMTSRSLFSIEQVSNSLVYLTFTNSKVKVSYGIFSISKQYATSEATITTLEFNTIVANCKYANVHNNGYYISIYAGSVTNSVRLYTSFRALPGSNVSARFCVGINLKELNSSTSSSRFPYNSFTNQTVLFDYANLNFETTQRGRYKITYTSYIDTISRNKNIYLNIWDSYETFCEFNTTTATVYSTRSSTSSTIYQTRSSTSSTGYETRKSTYNTTYATRASTSSTTYATRASTSSTTYATRSSTSATTYATRSSQYTSNTSYLTQSETYETSYITTSAETTMEG